MERAPINVPYDTNSTFGDRLGYAESTREPLVHFDHRNVQLLPVLNHLVDVVKDGKNTSLRLPLY